MGYKFRPVDRDQSFLMPPSLKEWLPRDHLAWFVLDAVQAIDLSAFYARHRQDAWGAPAFDPTMMVALLLYAYSIGERSSRRIERRCHEDIAFRVITANAAPDHTTIARFRQVNEQPLAACFFEVLRLSAAAGLLRLGLVALDGTKVEANASLRANRSLKAIESEVAAMLAEAAATDADEDQLFGSGRRGDELPAGLANSTGRLARLKECRQRLIAEDPQRAYQAELARRAAIEKETGSSLVGRPPRPKVATKNTLAANPTDPHSRIMKGQHGYLQGYNAQAVVTEDRIIVATGLTDQPADSCQLHPMLKETQTNLSAIGVVPAVGVLVADSGYYSEANLAEQTLEDPELFIAMTNDHDQRRGVAQGRGFGKGRYGAEMRARLTCERGREIYGKRRQLVEPVFGEINCTRGAARFMRRGLSACEAEWRFICATHNLLKLWRRSRAGQEG